MKPSKLRRAMKHSGKSDADFKLELARRAFNEGFGTTRESARILASADCAGESLSVLHRIGEGQGGMIARNGMSAPVSHGMTRSLDSGKTNRELNVRAYENHLRDGVKDPARMLIWFRYGMLGFGKDISRRIAMSREIEEIIHRGKIKSRRDIATLMRRIGTEKRKELRSMDSTNMSVDLRFGLQLPKLLSHRL